MSTFTYLVTVETERDSGLIASRDEQSESITGELEQAVDGHQISGIGARSDSEYSVVSVDIDELDKKSEKAARAEYDAHVAEAAPSNAELRTELAGVKSKAGALQRELDRANARIREMNEKAEAGKTRVYQQRHYGAPINYIPEDGSIYFQYDEENFHHRFAIDLNRDGSINVRSDGMGFSSMGVFPQSGNVVKIQMVER